ncbi:protein arginine N-methyltransferase 6 [Thrips palmi]|uniref:type I protein arginine methyltransferase n=1 Tax=Thrips palmi TaxID=161013 RepID=A0A6P8YIV3_THRPL|nr:protein arginine N-methyltransferase 6 [Thrips palmi]
MNGADTSSEAEKPKDYFQSYEDLEVHHLMLNDQPRTEAYRHAINANKAMFKDKIVVDVGAGTGILSIFCAQAGAKKVYAIEASNLAELMKEVVKENKLTDQIEVIQSRVEDVELPDGQKADVLVSEWMGFYLLHEGMLDSVLNARDRLLKEGGLMFPDKADIWAAPCCLPSLYDFWEDVQGVSMQCVGKAWRKKKASSPEVMTIDPEDLLGAGNLVKSINLATVCLADLEKISVKHVVAANSGGRYQGVCVWFTVRFPSGLVLSTAPSAPSTHWKQTAIVLPEERTVEEAEPLAWELTMTRDPEAVRHYNIELTLLDPEEEKHPTPCSCHMTKCIVIRKFIEQSEEAEDEEFDEEEGEDDDEMEDEEEYESDVEMNSERQDLNDANKTKENGEGSH